MRRFRKAALWLVSLLLLLPVLVALAAVLVG